MDLKKIIELFEEFQETDRALMHLSNLITEKVQHLEHTVVQLEERVHLLEESLLNNTREGEK